MTLVPRDLNRYPNRSTRIWGCCFKNTAEAHSRDIADSSFGSVSDGGSIVCDCSFFESLEKCSGIMSVRQKARKTEIRPRIMGVQTVLSMMAELPRYPTMLPI